MTRDTPSGTLPSPTRPAGLPEVDPRVGLSAAEVAERVAAGRTNAVATKSSRSIAEIVRGNVFTPFNAVIGFFTAVMLIVGPIQDALFGLVIVANTAIGVFQEWRAKLTLDRLAVVGEARPRVRRDGVEQEVATADVVLGDVVLLSAGEKIPVDGEVLESDALEADESLLTGENDPVVKHAGDEVMSGSFAVAGTGAFQATKVGADAYAAKLAEEASRFTLVHSELRDGINRIIKFLAWLMLPAAIIQIATQLSGSKGWRHGVSRTVAGLVPIVPEGLLLLTSVAFALGVIRLGKRNCLVQELPAIEGLARVDTVCLDKTGTLTEGGMRLSEVKKLDPDAPVAEALGALCALEERPNPTMVAIAAEYPEPTGWDAVGVVPFSSARKWSGAGYGSAGNWVLGAPDVLAPAGDPIGREAEELGATGLRVLMLGRVDGALDPDLPIAGSVRPAALVVLEQKVRDDARETLAYFDRQGVAAKVISGDNAVSVGAVAASVGLPHADRTVDARTLPTAPEELGRALEENAVFGRVTPQQKRAMVEALRARGHVVAMTGDGVNDVLALKDADIGVAMGSGSGATRAVAQLVLLDDRFATLPAVVAEGRRVIGNVERVANLFLVKSFYSVLLVILIGIAGLPFPFLPRHVTLIGTLSIGVPAFFLALAPNNERARTGFVKRVVLLALPAGAAAAAATFAAYYIARSEPSSSLESDQTTATITLFAVAIWVLLLVARPYTWWRIGLVASMVMLFVLVLAVPFGRHFFALHPDNPEHIVTGLLIAAGAAFVLEVVWRRIGVRQVRHSAADQYFE